MKTIESRVAAFFEPCITIERRRITSDYFRPLVADMRIVRQLMGDTSVHKKDLDILSQRLSEHGYSLAVIDYAKEY